MKVPLFIIPLVVAVSAVFFRQAGGPFWLGPNFDPSYIYLMNSLYLLDGITPIFVDHPGTTAQLLGAAVIKCLTIGLTSAQRLDRVITDPEYFLHAIHYLFIALFVLSLLAVGWYGYRRTKDVLFALFLQLPAFFYFTVIPDEQPVMVNVNSEALLITFLNIFILFLLRWYDGSPEEDPKNIIYLAVVSALALTTKVTFLPLIIIPHLLIPRWKGRLYYVVTAAAAWFVITVPIIPRYGKILSWLETLLLKTGSHGSGPAGFDPAAVWGMMLSYALMNPALFGILGFAFLAFIMQFLNKEKPQRFFQWLGVLLIACLMQWVMASKQGSPRYIIPTVGLSGLLFGVLYHYCTRQFRWKTTWFAVVFLLLSIQLSFAAVKHYQMVKDLNQELLQFSQKITAQYRDCIICGYYQSSSPMTALDFGDDCFGYKKYNRQMQAKYPDAYFYNRWTHSFHRFADWTDIQDIVKINKCVLLYGGKDAIFPGYIQTEKIDENRREALYRVTGQTAEEAVQAYLMSKSFEGRKNYQAAYLMGLKAKSLGFPRMDQYLEELQGKVE